MRKYFYGLLGTILFLSVLVGLPPNSVSANRITQHAAAAPIASVPISEERHHHLVLANEFIRAYEVEVPPHDATLLHRHEQDYIYVVFGEADITNAVEGKPEIKAHLVDTAVNFAKGPFAHVARDDGNRIFRNITVQLLQPQGEVKTYFPSATAALDAAENDPNNINVRRIKDGTEAVILETNATRALAVNLKPGATWNASNSQHAFLAIWIDRWRERVHPGKPNAEIFPIQMESWFAPSGGTSIRNSMPAPMNIFLLEFKTENLPGIARQVRYSRQASAGLLGEPWWGYGLILRAKPYLIGFSYAMIIGDFLILWFMDQLWKSAEGEPTPVPQVRRRLKYQPRMLGILERFMYAAAWLFGKPDFIAAWLVLKAWKSSGPERTGRMVLNLFLLGNGFSIVYGVTGGALVTWVKESNALAAWGVPLSVITLNLIFYLWARLKNKSASSAENWTAT